MKRTKYAQRLLLMMLLTLALAVPVRAECVHDYIQHRQEPVCDRPGALWLECRLCGYTTGYTLLDPPGHTYGEWYTLTEPACTRDGSQARECAVCGFQETAVLMRLGHDYVIEVVPPTCTARGKTVHECSRCHDRFITDETPPLGHRYDDGVILSEPTETTMGHILYTCIGCGRTYQQSIPKLTNPFEDVPKNAYYYTPVLWATFYRITSGIDETHFGPELTCNRAQVVTFLWRAAGKPEPASRDNPFLDVPAGSFYEDAVLWAYQTGITTGTDATHFSPASACNRAQVVTLLYRLRGCPEPGDASGFPDVPAGAFYHKAVLWAARRGITVGMDGGFFHPELSCSRAQIVTFLYRDAKNP